MVRVLRASWPALAIIVLGLAPFLDKAFTIDDTLFLRVAEHALEEPLSPMAFSYTWTDRPERMSALLANGPLGGYLLVPTVLAGGAEWVAHVTWWGLCAIAVLATVSLGIRIGLSSVHAGFAGALVASAPAVLTMTSTNMPDVPAMAFAALGMERLFAWSKEQRWHQGVAAALALGLAPMARSHTILLWPLAALVPLLHAAEQRDWKLFAPRKLAPVVALPLILWGASELTADPSTGGLLETMRRFSIWGHKNAIAWALQFAPTMPLVAWLLVRLPRARWWWAPVFAAATWWATADLVVYGPLRLLYAAFAGLTVTALADMVIDAWRRRDVLRAVLVGWALISLSILIYVHMSAKYFVPSAPGIALLVALAARDVSERYARIVMGAGVVGGLVLGVLIVSADARYADLGRRAAAELIAPRVAEGQRVWFAGHWGFQWYAEQAGGRALTLDPPHPEAGDAIVSATKMHGSQRVRRYPTRRLVTSIAERRPGGRVMTSGAGFWSNSWGYLPWARGHDLVEQFDLWELPVVGEAAAPAVEE